MIVGAKYALFCVLAILANLTAQRSVLSIGLQESYIMAVGAGTELVSYGNFKPFVEAFYNPDIILPAYSTSALDIWNKNIELRLGLKYEFVGRRESCNTPTYVE